MWQTGISHIVSQPRKDTSAFPAGPHGGPRTEWTVNLWSLCSNKRVRWILFPGGGCGWLIWIIPWAVRELKVTIGGKQALSQAPVFGWGTLSMGTVWGRALGVRPFEDLTTLSDVKAALRILISGLVPQWKLEPKPSGSRFVLIYTVLCSLKFWQKVCFQNMSYVVHFYTIVCLPLCLGFPFDSTWRYFLMIEERTLSIFCPTNQ